MKEIVVFQHEPEEDLGFFAEILEKQNFGFRCLRLFDGEVPTEETERELTDREPVGDLFGS